MSFGHAQELPSNSFVFRYKSHDRTTPEDCLWVKGSRIRGYYLRVLDYFDREMVIFFSQELLYRKYKRFFNLVPQVGLTVNLNSNSKGFFKAVDAERSKDPSCAWVLDVNCTIKTVDKIAEEAGLHFTESLQLYFCEVTRKVFFSEPTAIAFKLKNSDFYHFCELLSSRGAVSVCCKNKYLLEHLKQEMAEEIGKFTSVPCKPGVVLVPVIRKLTVHYSRREARKYYEVTQHTEVLFKEVSRSTNTLSLSDERARIISHAIRRGKVSLAQKGCLVRVSSSEEEALSTSLKSESLNDPDASAKVEEPSEESDLTGGTEPEQQAPAATERTHPASRDSLSSNMSSFFGEKPKRPRLLEALLPEASDMSSLQSLSFASASHLTRHQASLSFSTPSKTQTARVSAKPKLRARLHPTESAASLLSTNESKKGARLEDSGKHLLKSADFEHTFPPKRHPSFALTPGSYLLSTLLSVEPEDPFNCLLSNGKQNIHSYYLSPDSPIKEEDYSTAN